MDEGSFLNRPMTDDDRAFRAKIAENPTYQLGRDVYADYLEERGDQEEADRQRQWTRSHWWLRFYAERLKPYDVGKGSQGWERAYNLLIEDLRSKELYAHGTDMHGRHDVEDQEALMENASIVLGVRVDLDEFTSFSCSC